MAPPSWPASTFNPVDLLFKLPRELRDKVYVDVLDAHCPVGLNEDVLSHIPPLLRNDTTLLPEVLDAFCRTKTFRLDWDDRPVAALKTPRACVDPSDVRHLMITCAEYDSVDFRNLQNLDEHETMYKDTTSRHKWRGLMAFPTRFPRLQDLAIYMQKRKDKSLNTFDFGPVLYGLRETLPGISITFLLSFDEVLRSLWNDPRWNDSNIPGNALPYKPMGYVDMSDLIAPSTDEDFAYVQEHLSEYALDRGRMPENRGIGVGLLDESPENRRALAKHYAVKEPALLRCLMRNHFEIYQNQQYGRHIEKDSK